MTKQTFIKVVAMGNIEENMTRRQHWAKLAKDFKKNGRPFHYQYLIRKGGK
jgi:hypothetical protein